MTTLKVLIPLNIELAAIVEIVEIQAQSNIEEAKVTALTIPSQFRLQANLSIVRALAKIDFEKAKKMAKRFPASWLCGGCKSNSSNKS